MIRAALPPLIALLAILIPAAAAQAHALQPGYLEMRVAGPDEYDCQWINFIDALYFVSGPG